MKNKFGYNKYTVAEILKPSNELGNAVSEAIRGLFDNLGLPRLQADTFLSFLFNIDVAKPIHEVERLVKHEVNRYWDAEKVYYAFERRAETIVSQIEPYLAGDSLFDVGCGDGGVSWRLRNHFDRVLLSDVMDYRLDHIDLPFLLHDLSRPYQTKETFDTGLLITVLHHAEEPLAILRELRAMIRSRLIVIESVVGVENTVEEPYSPLRTLSISDQMKYTILMDWLYNRVFHSNVAVPFNFASPDDWVKVFTDNSYEIIHSEDIGIDIPLVPEHHYLYVLGC